jgi:DNA polymerase-3 subunit delta'
MFDTFLGNAAVVAGLRRMMAEHRLPQTLLFAGPEGVGKATLARLLAAAFNCERPAGPDPCGRCSTCRRVLSDDLSLPEYRKLLEERARLAPEKRKEAPLIVSSYPEFLTFPPDGPLAQVSIDQVRRLQEYAQFGPSQGRRRLFLIDQADRMDGPAANSLLKILEEPPPYLTLILTAANAFDLLPTIRSRSVPFYFAPLTRVEMERFLSQRPDLPARERPKLLAWSQGSPGRALTIDVEVYERRRQAMLTLLAGSFADVLPHTEALGRSKQEKLELHLEVLYGLLRDLLCLHHGSESLVNADLRDELAQLAGRVNFEWIQKAVADVDALEELVRRNVQKQVALEALAVTVRLPAAGLPLRRS